MLIHTSTHTRRPTHTRTCTLNNLHNWWWSAPNKVNGNLIKIPRNQRRIDERHVTMVKWGLKGWLLELRETALNKINAHSEREAQYACVWVCREQVLSNRVSATQRYNNNKNKGNVMLSQLSKEQRVYTV